MPHASDTLCFTVETYVVHPPTKTVLLRIHDKYGCWLSVGGHIDPGETLEQAAVREVKEEVGLDVVLVPADIQPQFLPGDSSYEQLIPPRFVYRHRPEYPKALIHLVNIYFAKSGSNDIATEKSTDCVVWLTLWELEHFNELEQFSQFPRISQPVQFYAKQALLELTQALNI